MKTCLNKAISRCKSCERDYNPKHHPNNGDCSNYHEINIGIFNITKTNKNSGDYKNDMDRKIQTERL